MNRTTTIEFWSEGLFGGIVATVGDYKSGGVYINIHDALTLAECEEIAEAVMSLIGETDILIYNSILRSVYFAAETNNDVVLDDFDLTIYAI